MNQAVSRLYAYENQESGEGEGRMRLPDKPRIKASDPTDCRAGRLVFIGLNRCDLDGGGSWWTRISIW
jgi:hypothetical protein